ncbi:MAG: hypothetical protein M3457_17620 [Chloroflexota bacterium]|nr:hypothetical protein [Chloroflexota bacterium]
MNHRTDHTEHQFDIWLDAYVAGRSTPASRAASDSVPGDVRDAARQFHGLAHGAERSPTLPSFAPTWEDFMHSQSIGTAAELVSARSSASRPIRLPNTARPSNWDRAFSTTLVAAIVLALSTGIWRASSGTPFGFGDGPPDSPGIPFGGQVAQDDSGDIDPADLPTAEDCTVEPLTIDEVIWYIQEPREAVYSTDLASPGPLPTEVVPATPPATNPSNDEAGPASPEDLAGAAETQRMLMACILADSHFQMWALFDPGWVRQQVLADLPALTGEDEARAILEEVEETGTGPVYTFYPPSELSLLGTIPDGGAQLLDTDPANSWIVAEMYITAGYITYDADGTMLETSNAFANRLGTPVDPDRALLVGDLTCTSYDFTWNEARSMWLVMGTPGCG